MKIIKNFIALTVVGFATLASAAGTISPKGGLEPLKIKDHNVDITITNGFSRVEVTQTFNNQHPQKVEGIYTFPLPESASLSENSVTIGENTINGEVVARKDADRIYEEEKKNGNEAAKAEKNGYQNFTFNIANIPANGDARVSFVYYQPLKVDTGMGTFLYPLEEGGTDEVAENFWTMNSKVEGKVTITVKLNSSVPLSGVRTPNYQAVAKTDDLAKGKVEQRFELDQASLNKDFVFYYRLAANLPGGIDVLTYKGDADKEGTFMILVSPSIDLKPLDQGQDFLFILDISGSMQGKIHTLNKAVAKALGKMKGKDRFRIYTFNDNSHELTKGWVTASDQSVKDWGEKVMKITSTGGTNLYNGIYKPLKSLDADRVTSVILVTDAVANQGVIAPARFVDMLKKYDIRLFGFLLGNSSNWPLMRIICEESGGFYSSISNSDDIVGKVLQAKEKVAFEAIHNVKLSVSGVKTHDTTGLIYKKVYRGQQLALFGRYDKGGKAKFTMNCRISGQDKKYQCEIELPDVDQDYPELERIWAMQRVEDIQRLTDRGEMKESETKDAIKSIGVEYQIVTDETSMLLLKDETFKKHGIQRNNQVRIKKEQAAQSRRSQPTHVAKKRSNRSLFPNKLPSIGGGGGAIAPWSVLSIIAMLGFACSGKKEDNE